MILAFHSIFLLPVLLSLATAAHALLCCIPIRSRTAASVSFRAAARAALRG